MLIVGKWIKCEDGITRPLVEVKVSILGRDVLDNFDVITSRRRNAVLLLAGNHRYHLTRE